MKKSVVVYFKTDTPDINGYIVFYKKEEDRDWQTEYCKGGRVVLEGLEPSTHYDVVFRACSRRAEISNPVTETIFTD